MKTKSNRIVNNGMDREGVVMKNGYVLGVLCGLNHSGNDRLSGLDCNTYQCCGCASHYTVELVRATQRGPVSGQKGQGGVYRDK